MLFIPDLGRAYPETSGACGDQARLSDRPMSGRYLINTDYHTSDGCKRVKDRVGTSNYCPVNFKSLTSIDR